MGTAPKAPDQSGLRFLGFDLGAATPDANTIRLFREKLTEAGALDTLFANFDRQLRERGYLAMGGQIADATLVAAAKQRNTADEKAAIKEGKKAGEIWPDKPARAARRDSEARWTLKFAKAKPIADGRSGIAMSICGLPVGSRPGLAELDRPARIDILRGLLGPGVAPLGRCHQRRIDNLTAHRQTAVGAELPVKACKQSIKLVGLRQPRGTAG